MSADARRPEDAVLRTPGSGVGRPEDTREAVTSTQTSGGLGGGTPRGGPERTPERAHFDKTRQPAHSHDPQAGESAGTHAGDDRQRAEDAVASTPPHGDTLPHDEQQGRGFGPVLPGEGDRGARPV